MKSFWTVVEKEISIDYNEQEILGLFNKKRECTSVCRNKDERVFGGTRRKA